MSEGQHLASAIPAASTMVCIALVATATLAQLGCAKSAVDSYPALSAAPPLTSSGGPLPISAQGTLAEGPNPNVPAARPSISNNPTDDTRLKMQAAASCQISRSWTVDDCYVEALKRYRGGPQILLVVDARDAVAFCSYAAESNNAQFCQNVRERYSELFTAEIQRKRVAAANEQREQELRANQERGFGPETEGAVLALIRTSAFRSMFARAETCIHDNMLKNLEEGKVPSDRQGFRDGSAWLMENAASICQNPFSDFVAKHVSMPNPREYSHKLLMKSAAAQVMSVIAEKNRHIVNATVNDINNRLEECKFLLKC